ncbi:MAG TPA: hypothetical protein VGK16_13780 [Candidatus Limnocylindrales bacterium]|jgi:hypothetical protein
MIRAAVAAQLADLATFAVAVALIGIPVVGTRPSAADARISGARA